MNNKNYNSSFNSSNNSILNNVNINNDNNPPISLLSADEKIKELKGIIKEKEKEINILKLVSQKFLSNSCESKEGKIDLEQIKKSFENGFELYSKIRELEEEKLDCQNNIFKLQNILDDIN